MSDENTISNIKINGTTYALNDSTKASGEEISNLTNISNENNALLSDINSKLDGLLDKVENSSSMNFYTFEETITEGLTYGEGFTPETDAIYDEKALIKIEKLYLNE